MKKTVEIESARAATREKSGLKKYFILTRNIDGSFNPILSLNLILDSHFFDVYGVESQEVLEFLEEEVRAVFISLSDGFMFASLGTSSSGGFEDRELLSLKSPLITVSSESSEGLDHSNLKHVDVDREEDDDVNSPPKKMKKVKIKKSKDK